MPKKYIDSRGWKYQGSAGCRVCVAPISKGETAKPYKGIALMGVHGKRPHGNASLPMRTLGWSRRR